jgi:hypothetical protein
MWLRERCVGGLGRYPLWKRPTRSSLRQQLPCPLVATNPKCDGFDEAESLRIMRTLGSKRKEHREVLVRHWPKRRSRTGADPLCECSMTRPSPTWQLSGITVGRDKLHVDSCLRWSIQQGHPPTFKVLRYRFVRNSDCAKEAPG